MPIVPQSFKRKSAFPTSEIIAHQTVAVETHAPSWETRPVAGIQTEHANQSKTSSNAATPLVKGDPLVDPQVCSNPEVRVTGVADLPPQSISNNLSISAHSGSRPISTTHKKKSTTDCASSSKVGHTLGFNDLGDLGVDIPQLSVISDNGKTQSFGSKCLPDGFHSMQTRSSSARLSQKSNTSHLGVQTAFGSSKGLIASGMFNTPSTSRRRRRAPSGVPSAKLSKAQRFCARRHVRKITRRDHYFCWYESIGTEKIDGPPPHPVTIRLQTGDLYVHRVTGTSQVQYFCRNSVLETWEEYAMGMEQHFQGEKYVLSSNSGGPVWVLPSTRGRHQAAHLRKQISPSTFDSISAGSSRR